MSLLPKAFAVAYVRSDEPEKNYSRILPAELFRGMYPGFKHFGIRANIGDSTILNLGPECWVIRALRDLP